MDVLRRWCCQTCGLTNSIKLLSHGRLGDPLTYCHGPMIEVVPATQLEGAVSGIVAWLRDDEAELIRAQALRDDVPPEDALADAIERRWGR